MRFEHFSTSNGEKVYVNPELVSLVEQEGGKTTIRTLNGSATVKSSVEEVMTQLEGEISHFHGSVTKGQEH